MATMPISLSRISLTIVQNNKKPPRISTNESVYFSVKGHMSNLICIRHISKINNIKHAVNECAVMIMMNMNDDE